MYLSGQLLWIKFLELGTGIINVNVNMSRQCVLKVENGSHEFSFFFFLNVSLLLDLMHHFIALESFLIGEIGVVKVYLQ